jgi:hypothetical protein
MHTHNNTRVWGTSLLKLREGKNMKNLSANELHNRLEALMARRTVTKALKIINTQHAKHSMEYELHGEL